jgi:hypothetical protein
MPQAAIEPAIPATERPLAYTVDRAVVAVGVNTIRIAEFLLETESNPEVMNAGGSNRSLGSFKGPHLESNSGAPFL